MRAQAIAVATAVLLTVGCQTASYQGDENSPYYVVPPGTELVLNRELRFDPGQVSTHIQNGRVLSMRDVQVYDPFCKLELATRSEAPRTIAPADMTVTRSLQYRQEGTFSRLERVQVAQLSNRVVAQAGGGEPEGGPPVYSFITRMDLRSQNQPEIFRLTCLRWAYPGMPEHITIADIRRTLDPLIALRLPDR